jgi:hypothetical protein
MSMNLLIGRLEEAVGKERTVGSVLNSVGRTLRELGEMGEIVQKIEDRLLDDQTSTKMDGRASTSADFTPAERKDLREVIANIRLATSKHLSNEVIDVLSNLIGRK